MNPDLTRRLPPDLACHYHSLPIAEADDLISVAMANPDDASGKEATKVALEKAPCIVRGDHTITDAMLAEVEIYGYLRLRQGSPWWEAQCELAECDYDMIAIASVGHDVLKRYFGGDLVASLMDWVDRPVLIAK